MSTATIVCGGTESVIPAEWLKTAASYYTYDAARARQQSLKEEALKQFSSTGNAAAAAAVAAPASRIFSDGTALFVAGSGKVAKISDTTTARRVYEKTFPRIVSAKTRGSLGVHRDVVRGVLACMTSDACWGGAAGGRDQSSGR